MFCKGCYDHFPDDSMTRCEYFYHLDHVTDPEPCEPREEKHPPKVKHQNVKRERCDDCHWEFYSKNLTKGQEPYSYEIYGEGEWCKLCQDCYWERCLDI